MADFTSKASLSANLDPSKMSQGDLKKTLEAEHPIYTKNKKMWSELMNLYLGEKIETFIFRHAREKEQNWNKRQERAYFFNYVQSIVDLIASFIFSKNIERQWESPDEKEAAIRSIRYNQLVSDYEKEQEQADSQRQQDQENFKKFGIQPQPPESKGGGFGAPAAPEMPPIEAESKVQELLSIQAQELPELSEFWKNVDLRGTSIDDYVKMLFIATQIFGHVDVFIDMPSSNEGEEIVTEKDRKENEIRPYMFVIFPLDLLNWELGMDGKFLWVRWREKLVGDIGPFDKRSKHDSYKYFTWTREEWFIHEIKYKDQSNEATTELVSSGENPLDEIPIARFFNKKNLIEPMFGVPAVKDIGKINIEILNLSSLIDEETYQKCLNILVMQMPTEKKGAIEIGGNNVLLWEGDHQPYYLAPASEPGNFMLELIKHCIQEIYRIAKLGGDTGVQEAQSGIAYTWEFNQTNRMLADKADLMERGENELHRLWAKWVGVEWKGYINYPDDFNVEKFEDEIKRLVDIKLAVRSPEFKRIMEKRVASRAMSKSSSIERARVFAEISVFPEEKQTFFPPA